MLGSKPTVIADTGGFVEDHGAFAMAMAIPSTQQASSFHPAGSQGIHCLLTQVLLVVVHSHIVPHIPTTARTLLSSHSCILVQVLLYEATQNPTFLLQSGPYSAVTCACM